jgi:hypothetical protein
MPFIDGKEVGYLVKIEITYWDNEYNIRYFDKMSDYTTWIVTNYSNKDFKKIKINYTTK